MERETNDGSSRHQNLLWGESLKSFHCFTVHWVFSPLKAQIIFWVSVLAHRQPEKQPAPRAPTWLQPKSGWWSQMSGWLISLSSISEPDVTCRDLNTDIVKSFTSKASLRSVSSAGLLRLWTTGRMEQIINSRGGPGRRLLTTCPVCPRQKHPRLLDVRWVSHAWLHSSPGD